MSDSKIEWTDATWNPTVGCSRVSPGCDGCYAIGVAHRAMQPAHEGLTIRRPGERTDWSGEVRTLPGRLATPLHWRKPRRVFVDSMSDLFHPDVPAEFIGSVWATMARAHQHTFQVLTKRPQRMASVLDAWVEEGERGGSAGGGPIWRDHHLRWNESRAWPLPNAWLGTSIESDQYAWRADHLRATPAAVRFLSLEPLLGPLPSLDLGCSCGHGRRQHYPFGDCGWCGAEEDDSPVCRSYDGIDWVIVGGESGPGARPMHPDWVRDIRDRCVAAGVPFFFKQLGAWTWSDGRLPPTEPDLYLHTDGRTATEGEALADGGDWQGMWHVGKKAAGRQLDGETWGEMPVVTR